MPSEGARKLPPMMTVSEFHAWEGDGTGKRYELAEGQLRAMAPPNDTHGTIQTNLTRTISNHLIAARPKCRLVSTPGIAPHLRGDWNHRIPDVGITCALNLPGMGMMPDPLLLIEILSPGNSNDTWSNISLYSTVPSVQEILAVYSWTQRVDLLVRDDKGNWPKNAHSIIGAEASVRLSSIDFDLPFTEIYRDTYLAGRNEA